MPVAVAILLHDPTTSNQKYLSTGEILLAFMIFSR